MDALLVKDALSALIAARSSATPCPPVRGLLPAGDIEAAYAVQMAWVDGEIAGGASAVGRKIGLTNPAVQAQLGIDEPDFGTLLSWMDCSDGAPIDAGRQQAPDGGTGLPGGARGHQHLQRLGCVAVRRRVHDRHTQLTSKVVPMPMPVIHSGTAS